MYLAAFISSDDLSPCKVTVRNMSATGALVEAENVPATGERILLARGKLAVPASVVWSLGKRCGVCFDNVVDVRSWLAPVSNLEQNRIDETVRLFKTGRLASLKQIEDTSATFSNQDSLTELDLPAHLDDAVLLLRHLEDALADDPNTLSRHSVRLQNLDIAMQVLGEVILAMRSGSSVDRSIVVKLDHLRKSSAQALAKH